MNKLLLKEWAQEACLNAGNPAVELDTEFLYGNNTDRCLNAGNPAVELDSTK